MTAREPILPEAQALIPKFGCLPSTDGMTEMSKCGGNAIAISASPDAMSDAVKNITMSIDTTGVSDQDLPEGWRRPYFRPFNMLRRFVVKAGFLGALAAFVTFFIWSSSASAEDQWIITHSEREAWEAHYYADSILDRTGRMASVYRASNGWLAVALGPFPAQTAKAVLEDLKMQNKVPQDSRVAGSACCVSPVARPLGLSNPDGTDVDVQKPKVTIWSLLPDRQSWSQLAASFDELSSAMSRKADEIGTPPHSFLFGTSINELDAKDHQCFSLAILLEIDDGVTAFTPKFPDPAISTSGTDLRLAAHSLGNLHYIFQGLLSQGADRWKHVWNLACANREELQAVTYVEPEVDAFFDVDGSFLRILGNVEDGFSDKVVAALDANPGIKDVSLGSGGGSVYEALLAGAEIRRRGLNTTLYSDCSSACTFVFMAGVNRTVWSPYPQLGFHMVSVDGVEVHPGNEVYDLIRGYADHMGSSGLNVVRLMMKATPADMHYPELEELSGIGVITWCQRLAC